MTDKGNAVVSLVPTIDKERGAKLAGELRELAAEAEKGQVTAYAVVMVSRDREIMSSGSFDCRLMLLGALEHAKGSIATN